MNFSDQWIEIFAAGKQTDDEGRVHNITNEFLDAVVSNYSASIHEAPLVIGHPKSDTPAFGWVAGLRRNGDKLEARGKEVDANFEELVKNGTYKKRSASFYVDSDSFQGNKTPYLRHVGFLGAQPPAVKGLRDIKFSEGESLTFEVINFNEGDFSMDDKTFESKLESWWQSLIGRLSGKSDSPANFSETRVQQMIADAVKETTTQVTANFNEQLKSRDTQIETLTALVNTQGNQTTRAQIIAFTEQLGAAKCPPAFKKMGIVEFMESLAASEQKVTVISFEEANETKTEKKTEYTPLAWFKNFMEALQPFIQFGEQFGSLKATGADNGITPERKAELREGVGLPAEGGAK